MQAPSPWYWWWFSVFKPWRLEFLSPEKRDRKQTSRNRCEGLLTCSSLCYCCSITQSCLTLCDPWTAARQASLSLTISQSLPKFMSTALVMLSSHLILWRPLLLLPSGFPRSASGTFLMSQLFPSDNRNTGVSASATVLPMSIQGWFPLRLTSLISLLSKGLSGVFSSTSSKASILQCSTFFTVQFSQLYVTIGKTIALTIQTFVGRVIFLLFNTLCLS